MTSIERSLEFKEYAIGCLIDVSGAFNYVSYKATHEACEYFGIDPDIIEWISSMLKSRVIFVFFDSSKIVIMANKGSPQGGVLPPLLWCLVVNELIEKINSMGYQMEAFSDDLATLVRGKFLSTLCEILQTILNVISHKNENDNFQ